jgi:hypothetical protein
MACRAGVEPSSCATASCTAVGALGAPDVAHAAFAEPLDEPPWTGVHTRARRTGGEPGLVLPGRGAGEGLLEARRLEEGRRRVVRRDERQRLAPQIRTAGGARVGRLLDGVREDRVGVGEELGRHHAGSAASVPVSSR